MDMYSCIRHTVTELVLHGFGLHGFSSSPLLILVTFLAELYVYHNKVILELYKQCFWLLHYFSLSFCTHSDTQLPTPRFSFPNMLLHVYMQAWTSNVDYTHMFHVYLHLMWIIHVCFISTSRLHCQFGNLSVLLNKKSPRILPLKFRAHVPGKSFQSCTASL